MEIVLVATILVLGVIVGLSEVAVAVNTELNDISNAIGSLNQSFAFTGFHAVDTKDKSRFAGSFFRDKPDDCDLNRSCDVVCSVASATAEQ
jgi:hypothetical protein